MRSRMRAFLFVAAGLIAAASHPAFAVSDTDPKTAGGPSLAARMTEGQVEKIDLAAGKLTVQHGPIDNLQLPPMSMQFKVKDPGWMSALRQGDRIRFVAERVDGALTITRLQPAH